MLDKNTKTVLAVAAVAGVGYYLWMQKKKAAPKAFANFMKEDDEFALVEAPNSHCAEGYTTKRPNGTYLCCNPQYWGKTAKDQECTLGRPTKSSM